MCDRFRQCRVVFAAQSNGSDNDEDDFGPIVFKHFALVLIQSVQGAAASFDLDVWKRCLEESDCRFSRNKANVIHTLQGRQNAAAIGFVVDRSRRAFEFAHARVGIHANQQGVAFISRLLQVGHMTQVKDVEATVCRDQPFSLGTVLPHKWPQKF